MYKRILVAVDGSATSEHALREAATLAREAQGQLLLVHVVDEFIYNWDADYIAQTDVSESFAARGRELLNKASASVADAGISVATKLIETIGQRVPELIAEEAETWPADLIVMGSHGRRGLSRLFIGSVAERLVRVANKPVLLIRGSDGHGAGHGAG